VSTTTRQAIWPARSAGGAAAIVAAVVAAAPLGAQLPVAHPELLRGRVMADTLGTPLAGATVVVTRGPDREVQRTTTGTDGRWQLAYATGTGDYLVSVTYIGRVPVRKRVTRGAPGYPGLNTRDSVYAVDVVLARAIVAQLAPVQVSGKRPRPDRPGRGYFSNTAPGSAEQDVSLFRGAVAPDEAGNLAALAGTTPGVTLTPAGGVSALGLGPGQTNVMLGGLAFSGGDLPRDARTVTRVSTSTYDPARGWFGGAQIAVELAPGSSFSERRAHVTADAPALQATDATGAALGQRLGGVQLSAGGEGALADDRWRYNVSGQLARRVQDAPSLLGAAPNALLAAGISPDSAARAVALARAAGVPLGVGAGAWSPASRTSDQASFIARIDAPTRNSKTQEPVPRTYGLTAFGSLRRTSALDVAPNASDTRGGEARIGTAGVQAVYSAYVGQRGDRLVELRTGLSAGDTLTTPYLLLPGATVLVGSSGGQTASAGDAAAALAPLAIGGNGGLASHRRTVLWETQGALRFLPPKRAKHRVTLTADARLDALREDPAFDRLGTYTYLSLDDFAAGRPATFSRVLAAPERAASVWNGFVAISDSWRRSDTFQLLYGVRLEGNAYATSPAGNPALARAFAVDTRFVPNTAGLSPRLGFTWQPTSTDRGNYITGNNFGLFLGRPRGVLRGGVGEFRNLLGPDLVTPAIGATGLPGATQRLFCAGAAVPAPQWAAWSQGAAAYPTACSTGAPAALADTAPGAVAFTRGYTAPRSWRGNLGWNSTWKQLAYGVEGVLSYNVNQPGTVDVNFAGVPRFIAAGEGRPVFVSPSAIDPATGALSPATARTSAAFSSVALQASDLRSVSDQLIVTLAPTNYTFGSGDAGLWSLSGAYVLGGVRQQQRGFDGSTFGDPSARAWARGDLDVRHQFLVQGGYSRGSMTFTLFGRVASGRPFTPLVGADVNGDGLANDRAFVFDPSAPGTDSAVAAGTRALLAGAPRAIRRCLTRALGAAVGRNACEGPWTTTMNARLAYDGALPRVGRRVNVAFNLTNPLGGLDQLLHGDRLRGWGAPAFPDPTLYQVRGFDPTAQQFRYEVNPRFGDTRPSVSTLRTPFRLTLDVGIDLGRPVGEQQLDKWLRPGRAGRPGPRLTAADLRARYVRNVPDPYAGILQESDSLLLTREQSDSVTAADGRYRARIDSLWAPFIEHLVDLPDAFDARDALKRQEAVLDAAWELSRRDVQAALPGILSATQLRLLPWPASMLYQAKKPILGLRVINGS